MRQTTLATAGFDRYAKTTRREAFLAEMEAVVPWEAFLRLITPFYPKVGNGWQPIGLVRMLRIYSLQQWFDLSDTGAEDAMNNSQSMRRFVGIDLSREPCRTKSRSAILSSTGTARSRLATVRNGARASGTTRHRHDCRCDVHQRPEFDEECDGHA